MGSMGDMADKFFAQGWVEGVTTEEWYANEEARIEWEARNDGPMVQMDDANDLHPADRIPVSSGCTTCRAIRSQDRQNRVRNEYREATLR